MAVRLFGFVVRNLWVHGMQLLAEQQMKIRRASQGDALRYAGPES